MGRHFPHKAHVLDLVSPTPGKKLWGQACTIGFMPTRADITPAANFAASFYKSMDGDYDGTGKVLVMSSGGYESTSLGGGTKLSRLHNLGFAGVVADGRIRDWDEIKGYKFTLYCTGTTTAWGGGEVMPYFSNVAVPFKGVTIVPGDYIFADESGCVVVPKAGVRKVLEEALKIVDADAGFIKTIKAEKPADVLKGGSNEQ